MNLYRSPEAFKNALEHRLRANSKDGIDIARKRQLFIFDRFLARITAVFGDAVTLKGGLVLELRLHRARTTKDVDLRLMGSSNDLQAKLQQAVQCDLGDFMMFEIHPNQDHPEIQNDGMQYEGFRFRAQCNIAGKIYGQPFGVDVVMGDLMIGKPDLVVAENILEFAGIKPPTIRLYPIETHIAEKLHAYTMPRMHPNSRIKDLPDIALLASIQELGAKQLRSALEQIFAFRKTHALPSFLPAPPTTWSMPYQKMASSYDLPWSNIESLTVAVQAFMDPILETQLDASWKPKDWIWQ